MEKRCYGCMKLKAGSPVCEYCGYDETTANAPHQLPAGTILNGKYLIGKVLGQGGFGITYLGWDQFLEVPVAVKEYFPNGVVMRECEYSLDVSSGGGEQAERFAKNRERFLREAKAIARLESCPEIVRVSNYFLENNTAYIVMEYVKGTTLKTHVKAHGGKLSPEQVFEIMRPVLGALDKVHQAGLVHRDISPDNIMLLPDGGVKLIDFGAVRDVHNAGVENPLTKSTEAILKHGYAPIEQYQKRGALGPWTDIYALCATIYYCLTGDVPMDAPERVLGDEDFSWRDVPGLSAKQAEALEKGMALLPRMRIQSAGELSELLFHQEESAPLDDPQPEPVPEPRDPVPVPGPKPRKNKWLAVIGVMAAVCFGIGIFTTQREETPEPAETMAAVQNTPTVTETTVPPETTQVALAEVVTEVMELEDTRWIANVLKKDTIGSNQTPVYGSRVRKAQIVSVTFYDSLAAAPTSCWDVSQAGDGSVMAWVGGNGQRYDLYIAAEGGVNGAAASQGLFLDYTNLEKVRFNGNFHTGQAVSFKNMFSGCSCLTELDLSSFVTESVTDMSGMFYRCAALRELDLSGFDTEKVTNMSKLFSGCEGLARLDISSFVTTNVTDMTEMFRQVPESAMPDVSGFDIRNVRAYGNFMDAGRTVNGDPWQKLFE